MEQSSTASTKVALGLLALIFGWQVYQAATRPVSSAEAYTYDRFVRPTIRQVLAEELPNRQVLYTLLEKRSVGLFHVSPFSIRIPSLLFAVLYLWSVWRIGRLLLAGGWLFIVAVAIAGLLPLWWKPFTTAGGFGMALALQLSAVQSVIYYVLQNKSDRPLNLNLAGMCFGLSVSACLDFAIPAAVLAILILGYLAMQRRWFVWTDRILIPALVIALVFLVLPLSHAHAVPEPNSRITLTGAARLPCGLQALRSDAGMRQIRIGASPAIEPNINFYRAQHRITTWERADSHLPSTTFDYYVLTGADTGLVEQRHLVVLYRDPDFLLARKSYDGM